MVKFAAVAVIIIAIIFYATLLPAASGMEDLSFFDESAEYALYTIRVERSDVDVGARDGGTGQSGSIIAKAYIGADFTVNASKTRIVADGFGYAANAYGAVRVWSLSDGFDAGLDRHLYLIGQDIDLSFSVYEDADLTKQVDFPAVSVERSSIAPREYLLSFSGPYALALNGHTAGAPAGINEYADFLYTEYMEALRGLLRVHYFFPRGYIYAEAESGARILTDEDLMPRFADPIKVIDGKRTYIIATSVFLIIAAAVYTARLARRSHM